MFHKYTIAIASRLLYEIPSGNYAYVCMDCNISYMEGAVIAQLITWVAIICKVSFCLTYNIIYCVGLAQSVACPPLAR